MSQESEMIARVRAKESVDMTQETYDLMRATTKYVSSHCASCELELDNRSEAEAHRAMGCLVSNLYDSRKVN